MLQYIFALDSLLFRVRMQTHANTVQSGLISPVGFYLRLPPLKAVFLFEGDLTSYSGKCSLKSEFT